MQNYLYHLQPKDLSGTILKPLNQLRITNPDLYAAKVTMYKDREFLLERKIPLLDCLWNDVLHLSPIPPTTWKDTRVQAGMSDKPFTFYKIDPETLDKNQLAIYLFKELERFRKHVPDNEFISYSSSELRKIVDISKPVQRYYKDMYQSNNKPKLFFGIPHILYKGTIDISQAETISV